MGDGLFLIIAISVAAGFVASQLLASGPLIFTAIKRRLSKNDRLPSGAYLKGLSQLLQDNQDAAIDTFLKELPVNNGTAEAHFALGTVVRRRGQLDRAILIHQNISNAAGLEESVRRKALLELAVDYDAAGILDRAETLCKSLAKDQQASVRLQAVQQLIQVYEKEGEWERAVQLGDDLCNELKDRSCSHWRYMQAHYCCELARESISIAEKQRYVARAFEFSPKHPRASLMEAQMILEGGDPARGLLCMKSLLLDKRYLQVGAPILMRCCNAVRSPEKCSVELQALFHETGELALLPFIAEELYRQGEDHGMVRFTIAALAKTRFASFAELLRLIDVDAIDAQGVVSFLQQELQFTFVCDCCGFQGEHWYWCCPACKTWL